MCKMNIKNKEGKRVYIEHTIPGLICIWRVTWLLALCTWVTEGAKRSIFSGLWRTEAFFVSLMLDSSWTLVLCCDLLASSIEIVPELVCTKGHAHSWLFESSAFIRQFLNSWCVTFWKTSYTEHIAHSILSSLPYYLPLHEGIEYIRGILLSSVHQGVR
jgi:hypothetical protein